MKLIQSLFLLLSLGACGRSKEDLGPIRAKVVNANSSGFAYEVVTFKYLQDVQHADGIIAAIRGGAALNAEGSVEDLISGDPNRIYSKKGNQVYVDYFVDKDGVVVAKNFDSLAMLSLYYSFEQIVDFWVTNYDFRLEEFSKFNVLYDPQLQVEKDNIKATATQRLNASYMPGLGDFFVWKTSRIEKIPLKMNPIVLAHEFGHKIFDMRFAKSNFEFSHSSNSSKEAAEALSGINEGLADFMAWLFLPKLEFLQKTLDAKVFEERIVPVAWTSKALTKNQKVCEGGFYCKGSVLNSALIELATDKTMTVSKVGTAMLAALPKFAKDWEQHRSDTEFDYYYLLNRIAAELAASEKTLACTIFNKWFDDSINQTGLKSCTL